MNKINEFIAKHYQKIMLILSVVILFNTCGNPTKPLNKRVDTLSQKIDSLQNVSVTKKDLILEGLRVENHNLKIGKAPKVIKAKPIE